MIRSMRFLKVFAWHPESWKGRLSSAGRIGMKITGHSRKASRAGKMHSYQHHFRTEVDQPF
jgi:hypothetical protein